MKYQSPIILFCIILFSSVSMVSCNQRKVLSKDEIIAVLYDIRIAESVLRNNPGTFKDTQSKDSLIESVLKKHNITQADLDSSLVWYSDNVDIYLRVNDSIMSSLRDDVKQNQNDIAKRTYRRPNINFMLLPEFAFLSNANPTLSFSIDSFQVNRFPDFEIELKALWFSEDLNADFNVYFSYKDTVLLEKQVIQSDSLYRIIKPHRPQPLKGIYGNIHLNESETDTYIKPLLYDIIIKAVAEKDTTQVSPQ